MSNFFSSDMHYGHHNIIDFCGRPFFNVEDMNNKLTDNINFMVKPEDVLYIIGDFSFYNKDRNVDILNSIRCSKVLVKGNHDQSNRIKGLKFDDVCQEMDLYVGKHLVTLCHAPYAWSKDHPRKATAMKDPYEAIRPKDNGLWLLHGHTHSKERVSRNDRTIHVGVDAWNYFPVHESDIIKIIEDKE